MSITDFTKAQNEHYIETL